jgi:hypothetical protein
LTASFGEALTPLLAALALLTAAAGLLKLRAPEPARRALASAGLPASAPLVRAAAALEVALGAWVLLDPGVAAALSLFAAYACFAALLLRLRARHPAGDCGCFGARSGAVGRVQVAADAAAALVALAAAAWRPHAGGWVIARPALALAVAGLAYAAYVLFTALPAALEAGR